MSNIKKRIIEQYYAAIRFYPKAPSSLKMNFRVLTRENSLNLETVLREKYFDKQPVDYLNGEAGRKDMIDHVHGRLDHFRITYIPFIDYYHKLKGSRILEIGGGTGCSTLALVEQGAEVESIDIDGDSQYISKHRLANYSLSASHHILNATEIDKKFTKNEFDIIIFFASLEHMSYKERMESLKQAWQVLKPGGLLLVLEAPNRLWFYDMHTSFMPFYFWLQDDIAIDYGKYSQRKLFNEAVDQGMDHMQFMRWGRGASYHEFELVLGKHPALKNPVGLFDFQMKGKLLKQFLYRYNLDYKFKKILRKLAPDHIGSPFLESFIDIGLIKTSDE